MQIEIYKDEILMNNKWIPINDYLFQTIVCLVENLPVKQAPSCRVLRFTKDDVVLTFNKLVLMHRPFDNIIKTLHELFEELHYDDYEIVDKRKCCDFVC